MLNSLIFVKILKLRAPVAQRTEQVPSKDEMGVRFSPGAPTILLRAGKILLTVKKILLSILILSLLLPAQSLAIEDPRLAVNNKFGIHIIDPRDLDDAARLVNSSEGEWGYVTFVVREDQMELAHWRGVFDRLYFLKLIPIVRIAAVQSENGWQKPNLENIDKWVNFLDKLYWPIANRYIVIGNEPNHAKEWGGEINPEEYANYLIEFSTKLKKRSPDFFVLQAGFDASAINAPGKTMSEVTFIENMLEVEPNIFEYIDGWSSHSYPNPNFSGSEKDSGRGSVKTYEWELNLLKKYGVLKELPIFITETGWAHNANGIYDEYIDTGKISELLTYAYNEVWNKDDRVVAVTPFLLSYSSAPFDMFSWKDSLGNFYNFYYDLSNMTKVKGKPKEAPIMSINPPITGSYLMCVVTEVRLVLNRNMYR